MTRISLIHPSRGRPIKAASTYEFWMARAKYPERVEHILSLDFDDPTADEYKRQDKITVDHNTCVVEATNQAAKLATGGILVYLSDDFSCPQDWDMEIEKRLYRVDLPQLLRVNDGYQPMENAVLTIPIMTRVLYEQLGYFFNPEYRSMWVDVDLYYTCLPHMVTAPDLIFPHLHYVTGACAKDETYTRSDKNWDQGLKVFNRRATQFGWKQPYKKMPNG